MASARRWTYSVAAGSESLRIFERQFRVYFKGNAFRRENRNSNGVPEQIDLFDGEAAYRLELRDGKRTGRGSRLEDWQLHGVEFGIVTFGVIPLLRHLQNPTAETTGIKDGDGGQERLEIKIASGLWKLYLNDQHLIEKVEIVQDRHFLKIEFSDYRLVEGVFLPFKQRLFENEKLFQEFAFESFDLSPSFSSDFFTREAFYREEVGQIGSLQRNSIE